MFEVEQDLEKLSIRCDEIDPKKENKLLREIVTKIKDTMRYNNLTSLSAPQVGYYKRVFCISFNGDIKTYVNPIIGSCNGIDLSRESCSSLPDREYLRIRNNNINVMYTTPTGKIESKQLIGLAAIVFQHELDHLEGITLDDIGLEIDEQYDNASEEERVELVNAYLDSIDLRREQLNQVIESTPELKELNDAINFMTKASTGEIKFEYEKLNAIKEELKETEE